MSKSSAAKSAELNLVRGVEINKVNLTVLNKHLRAKGLEFSSKDKVEKRVEIYADALLKREKEDPSLKAAILECKNCGGASEAKLTECPYCGTGDAAPAEGSPAANKAAGEIPPSPRPSKSAAKERAAAKEKGGAKEKANAGAGGGTVKVTAEKGGDGSTRLVRAPETAPESIGEANKRAVRDLDQSVGRMKKLQLETVKSYWRLGRELADNYKRNLYRFRVDGNGTPVYKSWASFVEKEIGLNGQYARDIMAVSEFYTEEQINKLSVGKLKIILRLPEGLREEMAQRAAELTTRELAEQVKELAPGGTRPPILQEDEAEAAPRGIGQASGFKGTPRQQQKPPVSAAAPKPEDDQVAAVFISKHVEFQFFARNKIEQSGAPSVARSIDDDPWAKVELANGLTMHFRLQEHPERGLIGSFELRAK